VEFKEPVPYKEAYKAGTRVQVTECDFLEEFKLECAGRVATVEGVGFYHGGDPLYKLEGIPGLWHEHCLRPA
jgi:hypothetical protein